jgi:DNA-binding NarL/FixJ family response regulator
VARFDLVEYKRAAPLDRGATPEQKALLRARAWLLGEWHAGREIRLQLKLHGIDIDLFLGQKTGAVLQVETGDAWCGAAFVQGMTGLFTEAAGLEATLLIRKMLPDTKVIGISMHNEVGFANRMLENGAHAYITKNSHQDEMFFAIREALEDRTYVCKEIRERMK